MPTDSEEEDPIGSSSRAARRLLLAVAREAGLNEAPRLQAHDRATLDLGRQFGQLAIVVGRPDEPARLIRCS